MSLNQINSISFVDGHPNLTTVEDRFSWLMSVQKITRIFSEKTNYDFDPLQLLEAQHKLVEELRKAPSYEEGMVNKKYHDIRITPPKGGFVYSDVQIKPEAIDAWKTDLKETQASLEGQPITETIEALQKALSPELGKGDLLNQSIRALTTANKENKAPNEATLTKIRRRTPSNLPQEIINSWEEFLGADQDLRKNFEALAQEQKLCDLLELWLVLDKQPHLDQLSSEDLIYFSDTKDVIDPKLDTFEGLKNQKTFSQRIAKHIKKYASQTTCTAKRIENPITLTQEPPSVAIFRGCAGNDCSSLYSFPYPNDPNERVFFIYDKDHTLKGYASAVEVMVGDEPALYVITINGSHVSAGDAEMIFQGLEAQKAQLGVKHIVLPTPTNIQRLINFPAPKAVYAKYADHQPLVSIAYKAPEIREAIETFASSYNSGNYDRRDRNTEGVIFNPKKNAELIVDVCPMVPAIKPQDLSQASPSEIAELLVPMHFIGKDDVMNQMLDVEKVAQKVNKIAFKAFLDQLESGDRNLTTSQWISILQEALKKLDIEQEFLEKKYPQFLYPSLLYRSDAYSPENIENTAKAMVADMRSNDFIPTGFKFSDLLDETLRKLNETSAFKQFGALLIKQLTDADENVRRAASEALVALKPVDIEIYQALVALLKDPNQEVCKAAEEALKNIKPADIEIHTAIAVLLEDPNQDVCWRALKVLTAIKPSGVKIHQAIAALLQDPTNSVCLGALIALGASQPSDVEIHQALAELMKDPNWEVFSIAAWALGEIKPSDAKIHQAIAELLNDSNLGTRLAAAKTLGEIKTADVEIHQAIAALLKDLNQEIRSAAAWALGEIKPADVEIHKTLTALLKDPGWQVRQAAQGALVAIKPADAEIHKTLAAFLKDPNVYVQLGALRVLGKIKPADVEIHQAIAALVKVPNRAIHKAASKALQAIEQANTENLPSTVAGF